MFPRELIYSHTTLHTWVVINEALVDGGQLISGDVAGSVWWRLEVQVILALAEKLRSSNIHPYHHLIGEARLLYGCLYQLQS